MCNYLFILMLVSDYYEYNCPLPLFYASFIDRGFQSVKIKKINIYFF